MAMPSDNDAPMVIGRLIGERFLASKYPDLRPIDRFIREMNTCLTQEWGLTSAHTRNTFTLLNISPRDLVKILRRLGQDAFLREAFSYTPTVVHIYGGPDPRQIPLGSSMGDRVPGLAYGKTGSSVNRVHVAMSWVHPDGTEHYAVVFQVLGRGGGRRYIELQKAIYADLSGYKSLQTAHSNAMGDNTRDTHTLDITSLFIGVTSTAGAQTGIFLSRSGNLVTLNFSVVTLPAGFNYDNMLPEAFRPNDWSYETLSCNNGATFCQLDISPTGRIRLRGNQRDDILRGTFTYIIRNQRGDNFPVAPFPGIPQWRW